VDWFPFVLFAHVLAAMVAVGANLTYVVWLRLAGRDRTRLTFTIGGIRYLDRRLALPSYAVLIVSGLGMVITGRVAFNQLWLEIGFGLYVGLTYIAIMVFAPALRRLLAAAEADPRGDAYAREATFVRLLYGISIVLLIAITALMVIKPVPA
jgi:uncharacterized membrane protein